MAPPTPPVISPLLGSIVAPSPGTGSKINVPPDVIILVGPLGSPAQKLSKLKDASSSAIPITVTVFMSGQAPGGI